MNTDDKKDSWRSFVGDNKEGFNQRKPKDLWASIETELEPNHPKTIELWKVYQIAAMVVILIGIGFFIMYQSFSKSAQQQIVEQPEKEIRQEIILPNELIEVESFYTAEINYKLEEVKALTDDQMAIEEIQELSDEFEVLRSEIGDQINDEKIVQAMIKNYRLRLEMLEEILEELKSSDDATKNKQDETTFI